MSFGWVAWAVDQLDCHATNFLTFFFIVICVFLIIYGLICIIILYFLTHIYVIGMYMYVYIYIYVYTYAFVSFN